MTSVIGVVDDNMQPFRQPGPKQVAELEREGYTGGYDEADAEEEGRVGEAPYMDEETQRRAEAATEEAKRQLAL